MSTLSQDKSKIKSFLDIKVFEDLGKNNEKLDIKTIIPYFWGKIIFKRREIVGGGFDKT